MECVLTPRSCTPRQRINLERLLIAPATLPVLPQFFLVKLSPVKDHQLQRTTRKPSLRDSQLFDIDAGLELAMKGVKMGGRMKRWHRVTPRSANPGRSSA
jgi:hypothetical protein